MGKSWDRHITIDGKAGVFKYPPSDTEMLDWLEKHRKGYGIGWICRDSFTGRGLRLHETSMKEAQPTVRKAIIAAMQEGI